MKRWAEETKEEVLLANKELTAVSGDNVIFLEMIT